MSTTIAIPTEELARLVASSGPLEDYGEADPNAADRGGDAGAFGARTGPLGLMLAIPPGYATAIWPASGIALAALLMVGPRYWPAITLGSFLINVTVAAPVADGGTFTLLRPAGIEVISRILGLLLAAIAVQLIADAVFAFVRGYSATL